MTYYKYLFDAIEIFAFILPALPPQLYVRLGILVIYFILHYFKAQLYYGEIKRKYTLKEQMKKLEDDSEANE
jgi:hypothetical protein